MSWTEEEINRAYREAWRSKRTFAAIRERERHEATLQLEGRTIASERDPFARAMRVRYPDEEQELLPINQDPDSLYVGLSISTEQFNKAMQELREALKAAIEPLLDWATLHQKVLVEISEAQK